MFPPPYIPILRITTPSQFSSLGLTFPSGAPADEPPAHARWPAVTLPCACDARICAVLTPTSPPALLSSPDRWTRSDLDRTAFATRRLRAGGRHGGARCLRGDGGRGRERPGSRCARRALAGFPGPDETGARPADRGQRLTGHRSMSRRAVARCLTIPGRLSTPVRVGDIGHSGAEAGTQRFVIDATSRRGEARMSGRRVVRRCPTLCNRMVFRSTKEPRKPA